MLELPIDIINTDKFKRRFWLKIDKIGKTDKECWEWNGRLNSYTNKKCGCRPRIRIDDKIYYSSRISYYLYYKIDPENLLICHECDNVICCNPNHMFLGTNLDNVKDMVIKGRKTIKLTIELVKEIMEKYKSGNYTQNKLALDYNVCREMIGHIVNRRRWGYITN